MPGQLPVTAAIYAAILVLLGVVLTLRVILKRVKHEVNDGDGGHADLARAMRAHGNFAEQAPFAILILMFAEMLGAPHALVLALGGVLVVTRMLSAIGLSRSLGQSFFRQSAAGLTAVTLAATAITVLYAALA